MPLHFQRDKGPIAIPIKIVEGANGFHDVCDGSNAVGGLKARNMKAQGNALGNVTVMIPSPARASQNHRHPLSRLVGGPILKKQQWSKNAFSHRLSTEPAAVGAGCHRATGSAARPMSELGGCSVPDR